MALIIEKPGVDITGIDYNFLYIELRPEIETHYDRVSVKTIVYKGTNIDTNEYGEKITPEGWERFSMLKIPYDDMTDIDFDKWVNEKSFELITSPKTLMYEYMTYEDDIFDINDSGDIKKDKDGNPIILHKKGEIIKKKNGTSMFYNKELPPFCETNQIKII